MNSSIAPAPFKGIINGFAKNNINDQVDLLDIDSATAQKVSYAAGVLTIKDGEGHTAQLHFSGVYSIGSFNLSPDGNGGTLLTDPPAAPSATAALFGDHGPSGEQWLQRLCRQVRQLHPAAAGPAASRPGQPKVWGAMGPSGFILSKLFREPEARSRRASLPPKFVRNK